MTENILNTYLFVYGTEQMTRHEQLKIVHGHYKKQFQ